MKKTIALFAMLLSFAAISAGLTTAPFTVLSGARWKITNVSMVTADLFYVGLDKAASNFMMLDLGQDAKNSSRFVIYGDMGLGQNSGFNFNTYIGSGYVYPNGALNLNLVDLLNSRYSCFLNNVANGKCSVYTSEHRFLGEVLLTFEPI